MRTILFSLLILLSSNSFAEEPPFDFKGIALGSDISSIKNSSRFECVDSDSPIADQICRLKFTERETIAGVSIQLLSLYYYSAKLEAINILFDEQYFSQVVDALTTKYGIGSLKTEPMQNRMGATFKNEIYSWQRSNAILEAKRYYGKIDRSSVCYRTDSAIQEFQKRKATTGKEKAKDL